MTTTTHGPVHVTLKNGKVHDAVPRAPKLSVSQREVFLYLARPAPTEAPDGRHYLKGRGRLASAAVLARHGLAEKLGPGAFNGEHWRLTAAGHELARQLASEPSSS